MSVGYKLNNVANYATSKNILSPKEAELMRKLAGVEDAKMHKDFKLKVGQTLYYVDRDAKVVHMKVTCISYKTETVYMTTEDDKCIKTYKMHFSTLGKVIFEKLEDATCFAIEVNKGNIKDER